MIMESKNNFFSENIMKYKLNNLTPFFILGILSLMFSFYKLITDNKGFGIITVIIFFISGLILISLDIGMKEFLKKQKTTIVIQLFLIGLFALINQYQYRTQIIEIPKKFDKKFVTIIYGVKHSPELNIDNLTLYKVIKIPEKGVLLTSSGFDKNLPVTKIRTSNQIYLNSEQSKRKFGSFGGQIKYKDKLYKYRSWQIETKENSCSHTGEEILNYEIELKKEIEKY